MRFPEFSGEWEKVLLGFISDIKTGPFGSTLHADDYVEEGTPIITTEHFKKGHLPTEKKGLPQVSDDDLKRLKQYSLEENDIVFSRVGSVDLNARVGKENEGWLFSGRVLRVKLKDFDSRYIHYVLSTQTVRNDIVSRAVGQTMPSINTGILSNTSITIAPSIEEQNKLGRLFEILDARIIAQSKIIEELTALRSALIEKCAKQSGNFFSLSDILKEVEERITTANQHQVLSSTVKGIFSQKEYFNKDIASEDNKGYKVVRKGHIVLSPQNLWMGNINYNDRFDIGIVSPSYKVFSIKEGFNPIFIAAILQTKKALNEYMLASEQGASIVRRNLNIEAFMAIKFRIPDARQQDSLSLAITAINAKLNNERFFLEQLTMQKSCLLENMFI